RRVLFRSRRGAGSRRRGGPGRAGRGSRRRGRRGGGTGPARRRGARGGCGWRDGCVSSWPGVHLAFAAGGVVRSGPGREHARWGASAVPVQEVDAGLLVGGCGRAVGGLAVTQRPVVLHGDGGGAAGRLAEGAGAAHAGAALVVEAALGGQFLETVGLFGVGGRDDVPLVVLGEGEQPVHVVHLLLAHADGLRDGGVGFAAVVDVAHVGAHGGQPAQHGVDGGGVAGGEQLGQVVDGDAQGVDGGEEGAVVLRVPAGVTDRVDDRGQRRDVPDHGQGAVLRVQRQGHPVGVDQGVDRRALGGLDPVVRDAGAFGGGDHARVV